MNDLVLRSISRVVAVLLVSVLLLAGAADVYAADAKKDDGWHFTLVPYIWLPSIDGSMNVNLPRREVTGTADLSDDDYLDSLQFALMLSFEAEKGRWSILTDFVYVSFENEETTTKFPNLPSGGLQIKSNNELQAVAFEIAPAYALYHSESVKFDVLAGIRYIGIDADVTLNPSTALPVSIPSRTFSEKKDYFDPIIGFKGRFELGKGWFLPYYADIGGFGINNEMNWQLFGGIGYRFSKLFSMTLGYRHLEYDFDDDEPFNDLSLSGGQLGFVFRF